MNKKTIFYLIAAAPFALSIQAQAKKPNIVFIAIDDMNDWVGYMGGHPQAITPNIDKLADDGVAFMNAHCVSPGCSPSRNALLYGVEPYKSGLYAFYDPEIHEELSQRYVSLPRFFKENGYETYGAGKIHHGSKGDEREWSGYIDDIKSKKVFAEGKGYQVGKSSKSSFRPTTNPMEQHHDYQVASYGIEIINKQHDKPYFVAVGIVKPHLPFDCPQQFFDALPEKILPPAIKADDLKDIGPEANGMRRAGDDRQFKKDNAWEAVRRAYLACISWADYNVGRVLDAVKKSPEADNTIVILWSDHGFHLGEKMSFRKFTLWEEATRVPFVIHDMRETNAPKGRTITQGVTLINVYRTLAEMAGLEAPDYVDGFSLVPQLKDQSAPVAKPAVLSWGRGNYAVRTEDWRFIRYFDGDEELYWHKKDSNEWENLAELPEYQLKKEELAAYLPKSEVPLLEKYVAPWSVYGADKKKFKAQVGEKGSGKAAKKAKKKKNKKK